MFVTMDINIADRILPSICSIAICVWENNIIIDEFFSYINPDCEVEEFFIEKHGITDDALKNAPTLPELWIKIYDMLENKTVFCYDHNHVIRTLMNRSQLEQLNMPDMNFAGVKSLCIRTWKDFNDYSLYNITEKLDITNIHNDVIEDARSLGKIIYKATDYLNLNSPYELFRKTGFAGGYIRNNNKISYRAIKIKDKNIYITKT